MEHPHALATDTTAAIRAAGRLSALSGPGPRLPLSPHRPGRPHGCGKSLLGQLLAGQLAPHAGHVLRGGRHPSPAARTRSRHSSHRRASGGNGGNAGGVAECSRRLARCERDYQLLQDHWDCESSFQQLLPDAGLNGISPDTPSAALSGGEAMRVALAARLCATPAP
ncbi:ATP-binding cassette domain-containing protein [Chromobacterium piscinae]|uniref:ATP-binding cassette domain-containing protein n=1 Tax=Chromobacterium piscinae TaxID=686831 RepID=UPI003907EB3C